MFVSGYHRPPRLLREEPVLVLVELVVVLVVVLPERVELEPLFRVPCERDVLPSLERPRMLPLPLGVPELVLLVLPML